MRMRAADGLEQRRTNRVIAKELQVNVHAGRRWKRSGWKNGIDGLRCSGPAKRSKVGSLCRKGNRYVGRCSRGD
ncbi:hypothetical protein [Streptomyces albireticuli]|uniref:hypothetical protein n=1 Tax=Streptomyces albireticuli TaxID=1940 RepID=UPI000D1AC47A